MGRPINCSAAAAVVMLLLGCLLSSSLLAQPRRYIQAGVAAIPGAGIQTGYIAPRSFFTVEGVVYVDATPAFSGGEGSIQFSGGIGGAIRVLGILRMIGSPGYQGRDFDVGMRFGPSLFFAFGGESSREENPFALFLEPFLRASSDFGRRRTFFVELGVQRPLLRGGIWFGL